MEEHGGVGVSREVRALGDGRGGDEGTVLEDAATTSSTGSGAGRLEGDRHVDGVGDGRGALELGEEGALQELALIGMSVGERYAQTPGRPLCLRLPQSLLLGSAVLEPDLHLCLGQLQVLGKLCPLGHREVLLLPELPLQGYQLRAREWGPGLAVFLLLFQPRRSRSSTLATCIIRTESEISKLEQSLLHFYSFTEQSERTTLASQ